MLDSSAIIEKRDHAGLLHIFEDCALPFVLFCSHCMFPIFRDRSSESPPVLFRAKTRFAYMMRRPIMGSFSYFKGYDHEHCASSLALRLPV
jgi:hypothetical protein